MAFHSVVEAFQVFGPWQLQISEKELQSTLLEIGKTLLSDNLLMPCTLFYIFILPLTRWWFDNGEHYAKNKAGWKKYMAFYNWAMCIFSLVTFVAASFILKDTPLYTNQCEILYSRPWWPEICKAFYWSKFIEYLDTFFQYVAGRPISYLHWFHHIGASINLWFLLSYKSEPGWIFVWLNSFIHTFMYFYYAQTLSKGESKFLNWFKPIVTLMQIGQFFTGFYFLWQYPRKCPCFRHDVYKMIGAYYYTWTYVGLVLLMFIHFFIRSYLCATKKPRTPDARNGKQEGVKTQKPNAQEPKKRK